MIWYITITALLALNVFYTLFAYKKNKSLLRKHLAESMKMLGKIESRLIKPFDEFSDENANASSWIIVFTLNRKQMLRNTIESIRKHEPGIKILVIDNGSKDGTQHLISELIEQSIVQKCIFNQNNEVPQWQKSFNIHQAFKLLSLEEISYIAWIDDDIQVEEPFMSKSIEILKELEQKNIKFISLNHDDEQEKNHKTIETVKINNTKVRIKQSVNGAFVLMPKSTITELGLPPIKEGIDDMSVEDWYYSRLIAEKGYFAAVINCSTHLAYDSSLREQV